MAVSDPISDLFTCMRNATMKKKDKLEIFSSNIKEAILKVLEREGYILSFKKLSLNSTNRIQIFLKYTDDKKKAGVITGLERVSRPGLRIYRKVADIKSFRSGIGIILVSTSKGLMTDKEARNLNIGGEIIGYVW